MLVIVASGVCTIPFGPKRERCPWVLYETPRPRSKKGRGGRSLSCNQLLILRLSHPANSRRVQLSAQLIKVCWASFRFSYCGVIE
jgi:hypothetical protein